MFNKLKQFKNLRSQAKQLRGTLADELAEGSAAFGKVRVTMDGNQETRSVSIDPELLAPDKKEKLESSMKEAINDAVKKVQQVMARKMRDSNIDFSAFNK